MRHTITFLRHAESNGNAGLHLATHDELSQHGKDQAARIADSNRLGLMQFDHIFCSPLNRTIETIGPSLKQFDLKATLVPELAEIAPCPPQLPEEGGEYELRDIDYEDHDAEQWLDHFDNVDRKKAGGRISPYQMRQQIEDAIEIMQLHSFGEDEKTLVVGHGNFFSALFSVLFKVRTVTRFHHKNAHQSRIRIDEYSIDLIELNKKAY